MLCRGKLFQCRNLRIRLLRVPRLRPPVLEKNESAKDGGRAIGNLHPFAAQIEQSLGAARIAKRTLGRGRFANLQRRGHHGSKRPDV